MAFLNSIQIWLVLGLGLLVLAADVYALVHAVRAKPEAFTAAGKQTKKFWVIALAIATVVGVAFLGNTLGLISIIVAGIYLADVRPAVDQMLGRRR